MIRKSLYRLCITGCFLCNVSFLFSQKLPLTYYSVTDGLVNNETRRIFQDSKGAMWFGTTAGVSRYDGHKFVNFTAQNGLSNLFIGHFLEWPVGRVWVVSNSHTPDVYEQQQLSRLPVKGPHINHTISRDGKELLVAANEGLFIYNNGRFIPVRNATPALYPKHTTINKLVNYSDSLLLAACPEAPGLRVMNSRQLYRLQLSGLQEWVVDILPDSKDRIWIATADAGIRLLNGRWLKKGKLVFEELPDSLKALQLKFITCLLEDAQQNIWIGTKGNGLLKLHPDGTVRQYTLSNLMGGANNVYCLYQDKEHILWIGTTQGVAKLVNPSMEYFDVGAGLKTDLVNCFAASNTDHSIWLGHSEGISVITPAGIKNLAGYQHNGLPMNFHGFLADAHHMWAIAEHADGSQLLKLSIKGQSIVSVQPVFDFKDIVFYQLLKDGKGTLFLSGPDYVVAICNSKAISLVKPDRAAGKKVKVNNNILLDKQGHLWIGTEDSLTRYRIDYLADSLHLHSLQTFHHTAFRNIFCSAVDRQGDVWLGLQDRGLTRLHIRNDRVDSIEHFTTQEGLSDNWVRRILPDSKGNLWIATSHSLDRIAAAGNKIIIENYGRQRNIHTRVGHVFEDATGDIWIGTFAGLIRFTPETNALVDPAVVVTAVYTQGRRTDTLTPAEGPQHSLPYYQNTVNFEFTGITYINEKNIQYSYLLEGANKKWSAPSNSHTVQFSLLPPGDYVFKVRALTANGKWTDQAAVFPFTIQPPFWKTWWFILLSTLISVLLFAWLLRYLFTSRLRQQLRELEKQRAVDAERLRISKDMHDDLGVGLTQIALLSEVAQQHENLQEGGKKELEKISQAAKSLMENMSEIIWVMNPQHDTLDNLIAHLREFITDYFENIPREYTVDLPTTVPAHFVSQQVRRNVFLVMKEAINNAVKYSGADVIGISGTYHHGHILLRVADNGKGFSREEIRTGNGLGNMQRRMQEIGEDCMIRSEKGKGTTVEIRFELLPFSPSPPEKGK